MSALRGMLRLLRDNFFALRSELVYEQPLSPDMAGPDPDIDVVQGGPQAVDLIGRDLLPAMSAYRKCKLNNWLAGGEQVFPVFHEGKLAHYTWAHFNSRTFNRFDIASDEVYLGPCFTGDACRGQSIYPRVLQWVCREMGRRGLRRALISVARDNLASIRGIEKAGFRFVGLFQMRHLGSLRLSQRWSVPEDSHPAADGSRDADPRGLSD